MPAQACIHECVSVCVCVCVCERERELNRSLKLLLNASTACAGTGYQSVPAKKCRLFVFFQGDKRSLQRSCCSCELN